ncbi:hypothetical protein HPB52_018717 [Rhipicephalus sanguineus]|uniref:Prolyl-tRNA synthetase n=1 Tax=Rhipicephalus sanguineus TaxID=34632 RepID=A0A9D4T467_RHISA|nr:hypothetical protein HPB52_018717 [Rhipicephalus sanguineus]
MLPRRSLRCLRAFHAGATVPETFVRASRLLQPSASTKSDAKQALCKSQKLMLDHGLISSAGPGTFALLPLAMKALESLVNLIDSELQRVGGQKTYFPCLVPSALFKKTGRLDKLGQELFVLKDRKDHDYCLGPISKTECVRIAEGAFKKLEVLRPFEMNCFGIGVTRLLAACLEMLASEDRMQWPLSIAPFRVAIITPKPLVRTRKTAPSRLLSA